MRERQTDGDSPEQPTQGEGLQPGQEGDGGGLQSSTGGADISEGQEGDADCGAEGRVRPEEGENVLLVMLKGSSPEAQAAEEDTVMRRLQDTAQQLGMEVV